MRISVTIQQLLFPLGLLLLAPLLQAQENPLAGHWVINEELSETTDEKVEIALQASGFEVNKGMFNSDDEYYRGGPVEQELYDYISYEDTLDIDIAEDEYTFVYGDYTRPVYLDNRGARVSLSGIDEVEDFSWGLWQDDTLIVEARPRDGGFTDERYTISQGENGSLLTVELYIQPNGMSTGVELTRVYNKASGLE
ncbi:MAG: hypothetical protein CMP91_11775 [Gammaproteobacteria bacterium]|nr:hypothetical protein [Gammaproteobacteria bacterium]MAY02212.1 hypothetical protein [Gammaproteobacteria bacterium]|tara:strand:+ start:2996 stop:3583 length:588 start_codon:yes stop_codon:yes gene_type:complete